MRIEYELRNLPRFRIKEYLEQAGGTVLDTVLDGHPNGTLRAAGDGWTASLEAMEPAQVGSFSIPRDRLVIEGDDKAAVERASAFMRQKTMRGGG
jgi:hypothetical protein